LIKLAWACSLPSNSISCCDAAVTMMFTRPEPSGELTKAKVMARLDQGQNHAHAWPRPTCSARAEDKR